MNTIILRGSITAQTPIAYSLPGLDASRTELPKPLPRFKKVDAEGQLAEHLYIPSSGLSGVLRRACADTFIERAKVLHDTPTPLSLDELRLAWVGGVGKSGKVNQDQLASALLGLPHWLKVNPILELFGAGAAGVLHFVAGKIMIENAVSTTALRPIILGQGVRSCDFTRQPERLALLSEEQYDEYLISADAANLKSRYKTQAKELRKKIMPAAIKANNLSDEEVREIKEQADSLDADSKDIETMTDLLPLSGFEAIPQGAQFSHRMILRQVSDVGVGVLLLGLDRFAKDGAFVGGHRKLGCGQISGSYSVIKVVNGQEECLGTVNFNGFTGAELSEGLEQYRAAAQHILDAGEFDLSLPTK
jgi:hypothetical protein